MSSAIYLVGFMGSGKSTIGRRLGDAIGLPFVDLDDDIEAVTGRTIADVFSKDGLLQVSLFFADLFWGLLASMRLDNVFACGTVPNSFALPSPESSGVVHQAEELLPGARIFQKGATHRRRHGL